MSPWGVSVIDGYKDIETHPDTLCGSLAHFFPDEEPSARLLYINGKSVLKYDMPTATKSNRKPYNQFNESPSRVTVRKSPESRERSKFGGHCLTKVESKPLPMICLDTIARRRAFYNSILLGSTFGLDTCKF